MHFAANPSPKHQPAIHDKILPGYRARPGAGEEQHGLGGGVVVIGHHRVLHEIAAEGDDAAKAPRRHARAQRLNQVQRAVDGGVELRVQRLGAVAAGKSAAMAAR